VEYLTCLIEFKSRRNGFYAQKQGNYMRKQWGIFTVDFPMIGGQNGSRESPTESVGTKNGFDESQYVKVGM
jgi:hypothetical protein